MKKLAILLLCAVAVQATVTTNSIFAYSSTEAMSSEDMAAMMAEIEDDSNEVGCSGTAVYRLYVDFVWSSMTHPTDYPSNAHWSPVAGTTHNSNYRMWGTDLYATPGVQQVAETGNSTILGEEIEACGDDCEPIFRYPCDVFGGTCKANGTLYVPYDKPRFSAVSMIAPSPDWFVGIHDLELCKFGSWVTKFETQLRGFDAGTDSGTTFLSEDDPTDPAELISLITGTDTVLYNPNEMRINPFGTITLELMPEMMEMNTMDEEETEADYSCEGVAKYTVTADFKWSSFTHPTDYPAGQAHWSPFSGTTHNKEYYMFRPGMLASPGVQQVAETGANTLLRGEIEECGEDCTPMFAYECDVFGGSCVSTGSIDVDPSKPYFSAVSMIAPSPDWFVGVYDLQLCEGGSWIEEYDFNFFPHDSGTDDGTTYLAADAATNPPEPVFRIVDDSSVLYNPTERQILPMGTFNIKLDYVS